MTRKARKNMPYTVRIDHPTGRSKTITYANQREMLQYVGMSMLDNGYAPTKAYAQSAAPLILTDGVIVVGGATYQIVED